MSFFRKNMLYLSRHYQDRNVTIKEQEMTSRHWTTKDLDYLPDDGTRYEIIDGELYVSPLPDWNHQLVCSQLAFLLHVWSEQPPIGKANFAPGIIFSEDTSVIPDVVWISKERLKTALQPDGKLHESPDLMIEILSPGTGNAHRDREVKLKLYSRRNAEEYWVVDWQARTLEVYRRENAVLKLYNTLNESDVLESPLLPGFRCQVSEFF